MMKDLATWLAESRWRDRFSLLLEYLEDREPLFPRSYLWAQEFQDTLPRAHGSYFDLIVDEWSGTRWWAPWTIYLKESGVLKTNLAEKFSLAEDYLTKGCDRGGFWFVDILLEEDYLPPYSVPLFQKFVEASLDEAVHCPYCKTWTDREPYAESDDGCELFLCPFCRQRFVFHERSFLLSQKEDLVNYWSALREVYSDVRTQLNPACDESGFLYSPEEVGNWKWLIEEPDWGNLCREREESGSGR